MEGGGGAGFASDRDKKEDARRGTSFYADQHGQFSIGVPQSRPVGGGGEAGGASDRDEEESTWRGASFHADQHEQSCVDVQEPRPMEEGHGAASKRA